MNQTRGKKGSRLAISNFPIDGGTRIEERSRGIEINGRETLVKKARDRRWGCSLLWDETSSREGERRREEKKKFQNPVNPVNSTQKFLVARPDFRSSASVCLPFIPDVDSPETVEKKEEEEKTVERKKTTTGQVEQALDTERAPVLVDSL